MFSFQALNRGFPSRLRQGDQHRQNRACDQASKQNAAENDGKCCARQGFQQADGAERQRRQPACRRQPDRAPNQTQVSFSQIGQLSIGNAVQKRIDQFGNDHRIDGQQQYDRQLGHQFGRHGSRIEIGADCYQGETSGPQTGKRNADQRVPLFNQRQFFQFHTDAGAAEKDAFQKDGAANANCEKEKMRETHNIGQKRKQYSTPDSIHSLHPHPSSVVLGCGCQRRYHHNPLPSDPS